MSDEHPHYDFSAPAPQPVVEQTPEVFHTIRLIYKSGVVQDVVTNAFSIQRGRNTTVTWGSYCNPRPLLIGAEDLAAVFQLDYHGEPPT